MNIHNIIPKAIKGLAASALLAGTMLSAATCLAAPAEPLQRTPAGSSTSPS